MSGIHHHDVHAGFDEEFQAFFRAGTDTDRSPREQLAVLVLSGIGMLGRLHDVLHRNESAEIEILVNDEHAFQTVFVHETLGFFKGGSFANRDELFTRRHDFTHRRLHTGFKTKVAVGDHTENPAAFDDGHTADLVLKAHADHIAHEHVGTHRDGIAHHAGLMALHLRHFRGLLLSREVLVDNADTAFLRERDREIGFGHRIHGGRDHRKVEGNFARELRLQNDVAGQYFRISRDKEHVVKRERFLLESHYFLPLGKKKMCHADGRLTCLWPAAVNR